MSPEGGDRRLSITERECVSVRVLYTTPASTTNSRKDLYEVISIMMRISWSGYRGLALASVLSLTLGAAAQVNPNLYAGLKWRNVGPFHEIGRAHV